VGALVRRLIDGAGLDETLTLAFMSGVVAGRLAAAEVSAVLTALACRPPCERDMRLFVGCHRALFPPCVLEGAGGAVNVVGTGGGLVTFNVSTATAFVASAAGARVVKSGSGSYRSGCGSLDVLRALGIEVDVSCDRFQHRLAAIGLGFVPPRLYSPLLRRLAVGVQPLALSLVGGFLNAVGPLLCPVRVDRYVVGVMSPGLLEPMARTMRALGHQDGLVCWSEIGMDELSPIGRSHVIDLGSGERQVVDAERFGFRDAAFATLQGGGPPENARIIRGVLAGEITDVRAATVLMNSAAVLQTAKVVGSLADGIALSREVVARGLAAEQLDRMIRSTP
jgi:anthranilate phosphoribosyltransferase